MSVIENDKVMSKVKCQINDKIPMTKEIPNLNEQTMFNDPMCKRWQVFEFVDVILFCY